MATRSASLMLINLCGCSEVKRIYFTLDFTLADFCREVQVKEVAVSGWLTTR